MPPPPPGGGGGGSPPCGDDGPGGPAHDRCMDAIEVHGLRRAYGSRRALDGVDLAVPAGTTVAVLGPNGAGKSTFVEILEGHRRRDGGRVHGARPGSGTAHEGLAGPHGDRAAGDRHGHRAHRTESCSTCYAGYYPDRAGWRRCSSSSGSTGRPTGGPASSPAVSSGGSRSVSRSSGGPSSSSSTSPHTGLRPRGPPAGLGLPRRPAHGRRHGRAHDPRPRRGRGPGGPHRRPRCRPGGGRRLARRAARRGGAAGGALPGAPTGWPAPSCASPPPATPTARSARPSSTRPTCCGSLCDWETASGRRLVDVTVSRPTLEDAYLELIR